MRRPKWEKNNGEERARRQKNNGEERARRQKISREDATENASSGTPGTSCRRDP